MTVASLFSGAGGLDLGFVQAGHEIVWANDFYVDGTRTYALNLGDRIICADIRDIRLSSIPECDIVVGGFPCQGFSVANTGRKESDERNVLYRELLRVVAGKRPAFFLAENVKGLLSLAGGAVFSLILSDFAALGYRVTFKVLNAADFGVPQRRERVIIVGVRGDLDYEYAFPRPTHSSHASVPNTLPWVTASEALSGIPDPDLPNAIPNHVYSRYKLEFNGYLGHRAVDPDMPCPTVTARGDDKGGVVVLPHPNGSRRMTCRELACIQSFPMNFVFIGTKSSVYRQIANAVPPRLARAVAMQFNEQNLRRCRSAV